MHALYRSCVPWLCASRRALHDLWLCCFTQACLQGCDCQTHVSAICSCCGCVSCRQPSSAWRHCSKAGKQQPRLDGCCFAVHTCMLACVHVPAHHAWAGPRRVAKPKQQLGVMVGTGAVREINGVAGRCYSAHTCRRQFSRRQCT